MAQIRGEKDLGIRVRARAECEERRVGAMPTPREVPRREGASRTIMLRRVDQAVIVRDVAAARFQDRRAQAALTHA